MPLSVGRFLVKNFKIINFLISFYLKSYNHLKFEIFKWGKPLIVNAVNNFLKIGFNNFN